MNEFFHMGPHLFPVISLVHSILLFFFILTSIPLAHSAEAELWIKECNRTYSCGKIGEIRYPFWSSDRPKFCGQEEFGLTQCKEDDYPYLEIKNQLFRVLHINATNRTMTITRADLFEGTICPPKFINVTLDGSPFRPDRNTNSLHIYYGCPFELAKKALNHFNCSINGGGELFGAFYRDKSFPSDLLPNLTSCNKTLDVLVPLNVEKELQEGKTNLADALKGGFGVDFYVNSNCSACKQSGGICGSNLSEPKQFVCLCRDKPHPLSCPKIEKNAHVPLKVGIGLGAAGASIAGILVIFFICRRRNRKKFVPSSIVSRHISSDYSSMTDLEKMGSFCGVHIFTYTELEEATNNFDSSKELGDGGFGTVYHGKLRDGRVVAVKRLYENNYKRVEQFMNEVEILTRLRHQNLVSLYGCTSRHSRELLLVYEYIPNGTVADHLHGERAKPSSLPWPTRLKIAVETTSALTYLHKSDIIHRDVKTNNILLDKNFCVKVADFGLSRLFPMDVTHVSTAPQGTPGYVDPDYHQCYQLTDKSDVYSFGVVLCELISSQPAVDITRRRHEINLSNMAINKIQCQALHELVDPCLGFESDLKVNQTITAVAELAFQCLQNEKDMRPSMEDVLKRLKEIQDEAYNSEKPEEVDAPADDVVLLKSGPLPLSPDSVTHNWISRSTTPSGSG